MAFGEFEGKGITHPDIRAMFTREATLTADWYHQRLEAKAQVDQNLWKRHIAYLEGFLDKPNYQSELRRLGIGIRLKKAIATHEYVMSPEYRASLVGSLGTDPTLV
jgi:hypothetical protein